MEVYLLAQFWGRLGFRVLSHSLARRVVLQGSYHCGAGLFVFCFVLFFSPILLYLLPKRSAPNRRRSGGGASYGRGISCSSLLRLRVRLLGFALLRFRVVYFDDTRVLWGRVPSRGGSILLLLPSSSGFPSSPSSKGGYLPKVRNLSLLRVRCRGVRTSSYGYSHRQSRGSSRSSASSVLLGILPLDRQSLRLSPSGFCSSWRRCSLCSSGRIHLKGFPISFIPWLRRFLLFSSREASCLVRYSPTIYSNGQFPGCCLLLQLPTCFFSFARQLMCSWSTSISRVLPISRRPI